MSRTGWLVWAAIVLAAACAVVATARGEWRPEYAASPPAVQEWYRNAELTEAAQQRIGFRKCCAQSEVVKTRFQVNRADGGDEWFYEDVPGHFKRIPPDIIHWGESAPGGQPTLFVLDHMVLGKPKGTETCFFPGDSGI